MERGTGMKILVLIGSGRKKGNTAQVLTLLEEHLRVLTAENAEELVFEIEFLHERALKHCLGCRVCFDRGLEHCPLDDGFLELRQEIHAADLLLLASPVYVEDVSGLMKTFIDRMAYACHRPEFGGKMGYAFMTYGASATQHTLRTMSLAMRMWGFYVVGQQGFWGGGTTPKEELRQLHREKIERTAQQIYRACKQNAYRKPGFVALMMFAIQQANWRRQTQNSLDLRYWQEQGWLEKGTTFYFPHKTSKLVTASARLTGRLFSLLTR